MRIKRKEAGLCYCGQPSSQDARSCKLCLANLLSRYRRWRQEVLDHYDNVCMCCGEWQQEFLEIDHIFENGADHRKQIGKGSTIYLWLIKNNFPSGFRLLCSNCNKASYSNGGICPHVRSRRNTQEQLVDILMDELAKV